MAAPDSAPWVVTGQSEDQAQNEAGLYVAGVTVRFRTNAGAAGSVFVPNSEYRVDVVRARIGERAALMDAVHTLKG